MKILWLCNIPIPIIANKLNIFVSNKGGWLVGLANMLRNVEGLDLAICFPIINKEKILSGEINGIKYYGFSKKEYNPIKYDDSIEPLFEYILKDFTPDIVHIWGTEYPHTLAMTKVFKNPDKTIINIQGLCSIISKHYLNGIPTNIQKKYTIRDMIKNNNLLKQKYEFELRGKFEIEAIKNVNNVIGRTTWDKACTKQINNKINYHFCNEILRDAFQRKEWNIEKCEKYSIFISQYSYPVKGFHFMLEAMELIVKQFPDAHIYTTGNDIIKRNSIKEKIRESSYQKYLIKLIKDKKLENKITFLGDLNEEEMSKQYLKSNVFISPSIIENSPNSLGEAMLIGVPCIASNVGGVSDMIEHNKEGFIYQSDAPYMIAYYVSEIFNNEALAIKFSKESRKRARITHSESENLSRVMEIYDLIHEKDI